MKNEILCKTCKYCLYDVEEGEDVCNKKHVYIISSDIYKDCTDYQKRTW